MADNTTYHKLPDDDCISEEMMYRYIDGKLNSAEMHRVESHTLECGLCADALEGLARVKDRDRKGGYFRIPEGTGGAAEGGKVISFWSRPALYYSAAACVLLLVGFFTLRNFVSNDTGNESPKIAEASKTNRFVPATKDEAANTDSILLPDNTKIATKDLQQSLRNDSQKLTLDKNRMADNEGPAFSFGDNSSANSEHVDMSQGADDVPNNIASDDRAKTPNTTVDQTHNTVTNSDYYSNTSITAPTAVSDLKKNKDDANTDYRSESAPATSNSAGAVTPKAATSNDSQANEISSNTSVNDEVSGNVNIAPAMNSSGAYNLSTSDTVAVVPSEQSQQVMYPNQETDADVTDSYNAGVKMLAANKPQESLVFFDDVIAHPSNAHYADAQWNKATALIQLGKKDEAKTLLNKIVSEGGKYKTQAQDKLKTL